jgi:hypothetical protein
MKHNTIKFYMSPRVNNNATVYTTMFKVLCELVSSHEAKHYYFRTYVLQIFVF